VTSASARGEERALELVGLPRREARVLKELDDLGDELRLFCRRFRPIGHRLDGRSHCRVDLGALGELVDASTVRTGRLEPRGEIGVRDHGRVHTPRPA
jgi:hypothetical protein